MKISASFAPLFLVLTCAFSLSSNQLIAATPFFWDEFDREDLFDSTVVWYEDPTPTEELFFADGSLEITPLPYQWPNVPELSAHIGQELTNFRLETAFAFATQKGVRTPVAGFSSSNTDARATIDWTAIRSNGRFAVGLTNDDGDAVWEEEPTLASEQDIRSHDVVMSTVMADNEQTVSIWLDGMEQNAMSLTSPRGTSEVDWVSFYLNPRSELSQSIVISHFALLPLVDGDYNASGDLDVGDIDLMADQLRSPDPERVRVFDVDGDGETNSTDHSALVTELFSTSLGDANLDGEVAFDDFLALSTGFGNEGNWAQGDFDANGKVEFADFLLLSQNFGSAEAVASVPEPNSVNVFLMYIIAAALRRHFR